jgi:hypothetical protein
VSQWGGLDESDGDPQGRHFGCQCVGHAFDGVLGRSQQSHAGESELAVDDVNTCPVDGRSERLTDAGTMAEWLVGWRLAAEGTLIADADAANACELRQALVTVMLTCTGDGDGTDSRLAEVEQLLGRAGTLHPLIPVITAEGSGLVPSSGSSWSRMVATSPRG